MNEYNERTLAPVISLINASHAQFAEMINCHKLFSKFCGFINLLFVECFN